MRAGRSRQELRPTDPSSGLMYTYEASEVVEHFDSPDGGVRVHYTRAGPNAVPLADPQDSGVPDLVEQVAAVYDEVGSFYRDGLGLRAPLSDSTVSPNGGDSRFDVYLLDFAGTSDGAFSTDDCLASSPERCIGYVVQENDFAGYGYPSAVAATRTLASHEYFHAIQDAYDNSQDVIFSEATAVWGTERFDSTITDLEGFSEGYLSQPDRSLDSPPPGPVPSFAYGAGIFFEYLTERFDGALVRKLLERTENGHGDPSVPADLANPHWIVQLDALLAADYSSSFAKAFAEFATWNLYTGTAAEPSVSYDSGRYFPQPKLTTLTAPSTARSLRVFYASTQYYRTPVSGRASMTAALLDDLTVTGDDREGLVLVLAVRRAGKNLRVAELAELSAGTQDLDTAGADELIIAVINTARQGNGGTLSKRPVLCAGSPVETAMCKAAYEKSGADAGVDPAVDAGVVSAAIDQEFPAATGCGCTEASPGATVHMLVLVAFALRRRSAV